MKWLAKNRGEGRVFQAEDKGSAKPLRQEQVDYVQKTEKSSDLRVESEEMKPGRWAGVTPSKAL